jgi:UDP-glucose 4-epimerase
MDNNNVQTILVTGGAGFIGSHTVKLLTEKGYKVIVYDNLSTGHAKFVSVPLVVGDLADKSLLNRVFTEHKIDAVIHFASSLIVEESMTEPAKYFDNNIVNGLNLLEAMRANGVKKIIFSSSAAVYGEPVYTPIDEGHPKLPINAYGETKLIFEKILKWYAHAYNFQPVCLRYFNACGASLDGSIGEEKPVMTHLIPQVLKVAAKQMPVIKIFGKDYPTPDGTCVRDYIHVLDLAQAHFLALSKVDANAGLTVYNVATGKGCSVEEVVNEARKITGLEIPLEIHPRRPGDPAELVADNLKIVSELGFEPKYSDLSTIISSSWNWTKKLYNLQ